MILIKKGETKKAYFNLSPTLSPVYYLFKFTSNDTGNDYLVMAEDFSSNPSVYQTFTFSEGSTATQSGGFTLNPGTYDYNIYQTSYNEMNIASASSILEIGLLEIVETLDTPCGEQGEYPSYPGYTDDYVYYDQSSGPSVFGITGPAGPTGPPSDAGTSGINGTSGVNGTSGSSGTSGTRGTSGTSGINGLAGTSGTSGINGIQGIAGTSGTSGVNGTSGTSGVNGTSGTSGANGTSGTSGRAGTSGTSGVSGTSGTSGINGTSGVDGTSGVSSSYTYVTEDTLAGTFDITTPTSTTIKADVSSGGLSTMQVAIDMTTITTENALGGYSETSLSAASTYLQVADGTDTSTINITSTNVNLNTNSVTIGGLGGYTIPTTDGSSGDTLVTDGSGTVTWQSTDLINFKYVESKSDLPTPVGGVITLVDNYTYLFTTTVDLTGDRLVCGNNTTILGGSSENCRIKSTGLTGTPLISSTYSLPIRSITIEADVALNLNGDGVTTALDWFGVNFTNCPTVGTVSNYSNFIMQDSAFLNSGGLTLGGTIGTVGFTQCLFDNYTGTTAITIPSTTTISRRFRIIYSSFITLSGETSIDVSASATISDERYILDTVNFSGGGTYITGLDYTSNKTLFTNCVNITNTSTRGFMYMINNTTANTVTNTWKKVLGTTTADAGNSKFTHTSNRLTYTGGFTTTFHIFVNCNVLAASSNQNVSIGLALNGTIIAQSEMSIRCATSGQPYFAATQFPVIMTNTNYIELFIINNSGSTNVTVQDMNMFITKIKE